MVKEFVFLMLRPALAVWAVSACLGLLGCSTTRDYLSAEHTTAFQSHFEAAFSAQVINPEAPADRGPVDGYPGIIAERAYQDYKDGFGQGSFEQQVGELLLGDLFSEE